MIFYFSNLCALRVKRSWRVKSLNGGTQVKAEGTKPVRRGHERVNNRCAFSSSLIHYPVNWPRFPM